MAERESPTDAPTKRDFEHHYWRSATHLNETLGPLDPRDIPDDQFRLLADNIPTLCWIANGDGYIVWYNRRWHDYCGTTPEEMEGWGWQSVHDPGELPEVMRHWADSIASGEPFEMTFPLRGADGIYRPFLTRIQPLRDSSGKIVRWFGVNIKISAQVAAEKALRESEARFRAVADSAPAPIWVTSRSGIEFINRALAEFAGRDAAELLGDAWMTLVHPDDLEHVRALRDRAWQAGEPYAFEARFLRHDGEWRWLRVSTRPRDHGDGPFLGYVGMAIDVTDARQAEEALRELNRTLEKRVEMAVAERERAEEALRQAQKMEAIGQLTGGIAHDFNNLLTVIIGNLELFRRRAGEGLEPRVAGMLDNALVGAERASALTQRLLAFSRRQPLAPRPLDANRLILGMSELLQRTLGETVRIETRLADDLWEIEADPHQLENAILNLAVNARDAMTGGGTLTIATTNEAVGSHADGRAASLSADDHVVLSVSDTGAGMDEDTMARAFEPFFTTKDVGKGTGLGLSMVYGFVRQSGGHVEIDSIVGEGTTVRIHLPRRTGPPAVTESSAGHPRTADGGDETILICEDDPGVRAYSADVLREAGYRVVEAEDAASALAVIERGEKLNLLFTDIVLPGGLTGTELARRARKLRPGLRVLCTTGYAPDAITDSGWLGEGTALIAKPFSAADLAARIREVLDGSVASEAEADI